MSNLTRLLLPFFQASSIQPAYTNCGKYNTFKLTMSYI